MLREPGESFPTNYNHLLFLDNPNDAEYYIKTIKVASKLEIDFNIKNSDELTPLSKVVDLGCYEAVNILIELGANAKLSFSKTCKHNIEAQAYNLYILNKTPDRLKILDLLFSKTDCKGYKYRDGDYFIVHAVQNNDIDALKVFLKYDQWPADYPTQSPLMQACKKPKGEGDILVNLILNNMIEKHRLIDIHNELIYCMEKELLEYVAIICSYIKQIYPYHPCVLIQDLPPEIFTIFVDNTENLNIVGEDDLTVLCKACKDGSIEEVKYLLEKGAKVNVAALNSSQPLHFAAQRCNVEICEILLKNGADINARGSRDKTPLIYSLQNHSLKVANLLLKHGADPDIRNNFSYKE